MLKQLGLENANRGWLLTRGILLGLLCFELFSFSSSREAGLMMFGELKVGPIYWATLLAFGVAALDFAALARLVMPDDVAREIEQWKTPLFIAWLLSAFFDTYLTYFVVATNMASQPVPVLVAKGIMTMNFYYKTVPIGFAVLVWVIQVLLVTRLGNATEQIVRDRGDRGGGSSQGQKYKGPKHPQGYVPQSSRLPKDQRSFPSGIPRGNGQSQKGVHESFLRRMDETMRNLQDENDPG